MPFDGLVLFVEPDAAVLGSGSVAGDGLQTESVRDAGAARRVLADRYGPLLVVADLSVADALLLAQLQALDAPPAIFRMPFAGSVDGVTLSPNVRAFVADDAAPAELRAAVLAALPQGAEVAVGDFSDRDAQHLNSLGREVERIARALSDLAVTTHAETVVPDTIDPATVRAKIKRRRDRERYFPAELFSDPAWDMLLDLTAARLERRLVSVSSLCIAAAVPTTTALRWIRNLCDIGLFERNIDPDDLRRGLISLSETTAEMMFAYLVAGRGAATA